MKMMILQEMAPQKPQYSYRNTMVSGALAAPAEVAAWMRIAFFCEFHGISWKSIEFHENV